MILNNYLETLRKNRIKNTFTPVTLAERIEQWMKNQIVMQPYYHSSQLVGIFKVPARILGPVLFQLGWTKKRTYKSGEPSRRWWIAPSAYQPTKELL